MQEFEPKPSFEFPWNHDEQGEYLRIRISDSDYIDLREDTTLMYLFPASLTLTIYLSIRTWKMTRCTVIGYGG